VALFIGWNVWQSYASRTEPPKLNSYIKVPIQLGDKTVLVGIQVVDWQVPPEIDAMLLKLEKAQREAVEKALKEAAGTNPPATGPTNPPAAKTKP
jgi:Ni,Fe-hydrogenase maturation factor